MLTQHVLEGDRYKSRRPEAQETLYGNGQPLPLETSRIAERNLISQQSVDNNERTLGHSHLLHDSRNALVHGIFAQVEHLTDGLIAF